VFRGATKTLLEVPRKGRNVAVASVKKLVLTEGEKIVAVMVDTDGENPTNIQFLIG
jgi:hypothetical protein